MTEAPKPIPRLSSVRAVGDCKLEVVWAFGALAGCVETVNVAGLVNSFEIYRPLRNNAALFSSARVIKDGYAIAWEGNDIEMTADAIEYEAITGCNMTDEKLTPDGRPVREPQRPKYSLDDEDDSADESDETDAAEGQQRNSRTNKLGQIVLTANLTPKS